MKEKREKKRTRAKSKEKEESKREVRQREIVRKRDERDFISFSQAHTKAHKKKGLTL